MQSALLFTLIALGLAAKLGVIWRCISRRIVTRHALFCGMVSLSLVRSALSLTGRANPYLPFWTATQWPMALLSAGAAVEALWRVAAHFRRMRSFGIMLLGIIVCVAATVAFGVGLVRAHWNGPLRGALLFDQYTQLGLLVITLLSVVFFWQFRRVPVRPNASRHLRVLALLFGSYFVGTFVAQASRGEWHFLSNLVITGGTVIAYGWWVVRTTPRGELLPFSPRASLSMNEVVAAEAAEQRVAREISRVSVKALRKALRP